MSCPKCGDKIPVGATKCPSCGAKVAKEPDADVRHPPVDHNGHRTDARPAQGYDPDHDGD